MQREDLGDADLVEIQLEFDQIRAFLLTYSVVMANKNGKTSPVARAANKAVDALDEVRWSMENIMTNAEWKEWRVEFHKRRDEENSSRAGVVHPLPAVNTHIKGA